MKKCAKVKNPCKICLQTVTNKNGVQCKGACKKWAHYTCLNYTPGKIQDIKAGLIIITCPCPNCNVAADKKEVLTDPPFTCNKQECPANTKPKCAIPECPLNKPAASVPSEINPTTPPPNSAQKPIPQAISDRGLTSRGVSPKSSCNPSCTGVKPVKEVKEKGVKAKGIKPSKIAKNSSKASKASKTSMTSVKDPNENPPCSAVDCKSSLSSRLPQRNVPTRDTGFVANLTPKSASCSCLSGGGASLRTDGVNASTEIDISNQGTNTQSFKGGDFKMSRSDSRLFTSQSKATDKALLCTIHELCSTVGQLSNQIKNLMCKMITTLEKPNEEKR